MERHPFALFAGEIVHELRTPLSVMFGDIDLALARDRTAEDYRKTLTRLAERVTDLLDMTSDFAVLGETGESSDLSSGWANLRAVFAALSERYGPQRGKPVALGAPVDVCDVEGDERLLIGALSLLVEHALRHRRDGSLVRLRALQPSDATRARRIDLVLEAVPAGFVGSTWQRVSAGGGPSLVLPGPLRVELAARAIHECGGTVEVADEGGTERVRIQLRLSEQSAEAGDGS